MISFFFLFFFCTHFILNILQWGNLKKSREHLNLPHNIHLILIDTFRCIQTQCRWNDWFMIFDTRLGITFFFSSIHVMFVLIFYGIALWKSFLAIGNKKQSQTNLHKHNKIDILPSIGLKHIFKIKKKKILSYQHILGCGMLFVFINAVIFRKLFWLFCYV